MQTSRILWRVFGGIAGVIWLFCSLLDSKSPFNDPITAAWLLVAVLSFAVASICAAIDQPDADNTP